MMESVNNLPQWVLWAAIAVIVLLSAVAVFLHFKLYQLRQRQRVREREAVEAQREQEERNRRSIEIISRALLADQVTLTEACIRIFTLAQGEALAMHQEKQLEPIRKLVDATAHIPILDRWQALSKKEKRQFEQERLKIEAVHREDCLAAARVLALGAH